jgi:acyl-CoA dehydrogenase
MLVARAVGAYSMLRQQFGIEIGKFEGIQAPLADIAGGAYFLEAARRYTCGALDQGAKPAVVTAITKYHFTEYFRKVINHGMDICGGAGISLGPKNLLAHPYIACPIGVTVEGANILTRTLMIFGQGAIRCHPFALQEIHAVEENNLAKFDKAFWAHIGHVIRNFVRMLLLFVTRGLIAKPAKLNQLTRYYQKLSWISATFAFFADLAMILFGGNLKRKENITGRFGDILSWMYVSSAVMKRYEAEGSLKEDLPLVLWSLQLANHNMQQAFLGLFDNMGILFKIPKFLFQINSFGSMPSDELSLKVAMSIQKPGKQRDRLTDGMFIPKEEEQHLAKIEKAFLLMHENKDLYKKLLQAQRKKQIRKADTDSMIQAALACGVFTEIEASKCLEVEALRREVISVDEYTQEEYIQRSK